MFDCGSAEFLQCSDVVSVNTDGFGQANLFDCVFSGSGDFNNIAWFRILGTGEDITISTCASNLDYSQEIHVYTGQCGSLNCVDGDASGCSSSSLPELTFMSVSGTVYYVMIGSFGSNSVGGDLSIELMCGDCGDRGVIVLTSPNDFEMGDVHLLETNSAVIADNMISTGANIEYDGRQHVSLLQNFEVEAGAIFHAYTTGCN